MINETTNLSVSINIKGANDISVPVMYLSASLDNTNMNLTLNVNTTNKELATLNAVEVKLRFEEFMAAVKERAIDLGYAQF